MALELPYGGKNLNPNGSSNFDESYGYYNSLQEACLAVPLAMRKGGRTVGIKQADGSIVEYWWANDNDLSDEGLVEKTSGGDNKSVLLTSEDDIDDITTPGHYHTFQDDVASNFPAEDGGAMKVLTSGDGEIYQIVYSANGELLSRSYFQGAFTGWNRYAPTHWVNNNFARISDLYRGNELLNYGIVQTSGYSYNVWADRYIINNVLYTTRIEGTVTLDPAHPTLDRFDGIMIKVVSGGPNEIIVKTGIPSENPVSPNIDTQTELLVRFILVKAGTSEPDIDIVQIYNENLGSPNEWTVSTIGAVDPNNTEFASKGTKSIKFPVNGGIPELLLTPDSPVSFEDFEELLIDVRTITDYHLFNLEINGVWIHQPTMYNPKGYLPDGNWHTISYSKNEIVTKFEQVGADSTSITEIKLWNDGVGGAYWVDNIRLTTDDNGGGTPPVIIQRTSDIPINDGATGVSPYAEMRDLQEMIFTTDPSLYLDPLTNELRANVSDFSEKYIYTGGAQEFILTSTPAKIIYISVNGQLLEDPLTQWSIDVPTKTITILDEMDTGDRVTVHYQYFITT